MALTVEEKKRLDKLGFANGGGYSDFLTGVQKQNPSSDKFLFIGLGGKGCSTVAHLKTEVSKKIKCPTNKKKPDNFEYLAIDTDDNSLKQLCHKGMGEVGLSNAPQDQEVFHLYDANLAAVLKDPGKWPDNIKSWMNESLSANLVGAGAGGIRQAGRGLLFGVDTIGKLWTSISNKFTRLEPGDETNLIVYVFAGVGGGTGSGTIVDIPYIVREIARKAGWAIKVYGYIFLPDTYNVERNSAPHIEKNSYAALQEIDSLMNLDNMQGAGHFKAFYAPDYVIDSTDNIFESCVLVSGKRRTGQVPEPARFSQRVAIDNVLTQITDTTDSNGQMISGSFLDNQSVAVKMKVNAMGDDIPKNAYFQYLGIGIGAVELPLDQMLAYVAKGVVDKMQAGWAIHATQQDADTALRSYGLDPASVGNQIIQDSAVGLFKYTKGMKDGITREMVKDQRWYNQIKALWMGYHTSMYEQWDIARQKNTSRVANNIAKDFQAKFTGPHFGIYFLRELLACRRVDGDLINGTLEQIKKDYYETQLESLINGARAGRQQAIADMNRIENGHYVFFPFDEYGEACVKRLVWEDKEYLYDHYVRKCLDEAIVDLKGKIAEVQKYIDIFAYIKGLIDGNYQLAMSGNMPSHAEYAKQLLDFSQDESEVKSVIAYLDKLLNQKTDAGLVTAFESKIWGNKKRWDSSSEDYDPIQTFVDFLEEQFSPIVQLSLDQFLMMHFKAEGVSEAINKMCDQIKQNASVLFPSIPQMPMSNLPSNNWIIVPANAGTLTHDVDAYVRGVSNAKAAHSSDRNRIYWYNLTAGIPMFALPDIHSYENEYKTNLKNNDFGVHLQETVVDNWRDLPLLDNRAFWPQGYVDQDEVRYMQLVQRNTDVLVKAGLIQQIESNNVEEQMGDTDLGDSTMPQTEQKPYKAYVLNDDVLTKKGKNEILTWCKNTYMQNPVYKDGLMDAGAGFVNELYNFCNTNRDSMREIPIQNGSMMMNITNSDNLYKAMRMQRFLYKRLCKTFEIYKECRDMIDQHNQTLLKNQKLNADIVRFAKLIKAGIIQIQDEEELAYYEDSMGKQTVFVNYFSLNPVEKTYAVYHVFEKFCEIDEQIVAELEKIHDEYIEQAKQDKEMINAYNSRGVQLKARANAAINQLNKYTEQQKFAMIGKPEMLNMLNNFYSRLNLYC